MPDEGLDARIDRASEWVTDKVTAIQIIIMELEKLQELSERHELVKVFDDVQPIDVTVKEV